MKFSFGGLAQTVSATEDESGDLYANNGYVFSIMDKDTLYRDYKKDNTLHRVK